MELQGRDLKIELRGDDVAVLHGELAQLGFEIPPNERTELLFGSGTLKGVREFQRRQGLAPTGVVDETTARALTVALGDRRPPGRFSVSGVVRRAAGRPAGEVLVRAVDHDLRASEPLGEARTDAAGRYEIVYKPAQFQRSERASADLRVAAIGADGKELAASPSLFNAKAEEIVDLTIDAPDERQSEFQDLLELLKPLTGPLQLHELTEDDTHQDVTFLAGETGREGQHIAFIILAHRLAERARIPAEALYGLLRIGLPTTLSALAARPADEHRRALTAAIAAGIISARLAPELDAMVARLRELATELSLEQRPAEKAPPTGEVLGLVLDNPEQQREFYRAYQAHAGEPAAFWSKLRERPELADKVDDLQFTLQLSGLTNNHLPLMRELQRTRSDHHVGSIADLAAYDQAQWLELIARPGVGVPPDFPGAENEQRARAYANRLVSALEQAFPAAAYAARIAKDDLPSREGLQAFFSANTDFDPKTTRVAAYLETHREALDGVPEAQRHTVTEQLRTMQRLSRIAPSYTQVSALMKAGVHSAYALTRMGETMVGLRLGDALGGRAEAMRIYENAKQSTATAMVLMAEHAMESAHLPTTAVADVAPDVAAGIADWPTLFGSLDLCECDHCRSVYGPAAYLVDCLHYLSDRRLVDTITRDAQGNITGVTFQKVPAAGGGLRDRTAKDALFARRPDIGEIELTCENTNTPVPYIDLVNEILEDYIAPPPAFVPFNLNPAREADLAARTVTPALVAAFAPPLSAQATITIKRAGAWWTIDDLPFTYTVRKDAVQLRVFSRGRQTRGSAEELAANPQYQNTAAYAAVSARISPWRLPFDLWAAEARVYLGHLETSRRELMETFLPGDRAALLDHAGIVREHIGFTSAESDLVTGVTTSQAGAASPGVWNLWGFPQQTLDATHGIPDPADSTAWITSGNWLTRLTGRVDVFLQQSGLTYKELLALLSTDAINPPDGGGVRPVTIQSIDPTTPDTCGLDRLRLVGMTEAIALKVPPFVRLWRRLGWHLYDVDRALRAFGAAGIDVTVVRRLSHVSRLQARLNVPVDRLFAFWAPIETSTYRDHQKSGAPELPSLYARLFRNKEVTNPLDPAFTEDPASLAGTMSDHTAALAAALGISAEDVGRLLNDRAVIPADPGNPALPHDLLSLDYLSRLYRHAVLARRLKLSIADYLSVRSLMADNPFATTTATVRFAERLDAIKASGLTIAQLDYLLRHASSPSAAAAALTESRAATLLTELRAAVQVIVAANTFTTDPSAPGGVTADADGTLTREKLAPLNWDPAVVDQVIAIVNGAWIFEAPLATLNPAITIPPAFDSRLSYDSAAQRLRVTGPLTTAERATLQGLPGVDAPFTTAVQGLFDAPRRFVRRNMRSFSVADHAHPLAALPATVVFPPALRAKVYFDAAAATLHARGALSEAERDTLLGLSTNAADPNHAAWLAAVSALFGLPDTFVPAAGDAFLTADGPGNDAAALFDTAVTPADRFALILAELLPWLAATLSRRTVIQRLGEALQIDLEVSERLLTEWLNSPAAPAERLISEFLAPAFAASDPAVAVTPPAFGDAFNALTRLHKVALLVTRLQLGATELKWLIAFGPTAGWPDLNQLPLAAATPAADALPKWERVWRLLALRRQLPQGTPLIDELMIIARGVPGAATNAEKDAAKTAWIDRLLLATGWSANDVTELTGDKANHLATGLLAAAFPAEYADERLMVRLRDAVALLRRLGISGALARTVVTADVAEQTARDIRQTVRAKYDEAAWLTIAKPLRDQLRSQQRDALVAWLLANPSTTHRWRDANDVYAHFLVDIEMSPCQIASRISLAMASTQLFVQRCLLNLEPEVLASAEVDVVWREWRWMRNYRMWEANRKVFLYPENWIEPDLRDDKTPIFRELEGELLQNEVTSETVEAAFAAYLDRLDQVARLEIVGTYHEQETDLVGNKAVDILHVIARTYGTPNVYFYRRRLDATVWTPWERVDVDIEGDQIMPVVWNRRLYLCWLSFVEQSRMDSANMPAPGADLPQPDKYFELRLSWSVYKSGRWEAKKTSEDYYEALWLESTWFEPKQAYTSKAFLQNDHLTVRVYSYTLGRYQWPAAEFRFDACHGTPTVHGLSIGMGDLPPVVHMDGTLLKATQFEESNLVGDATGDELVLFTGNFPTTGVAEPTFDTKKNNIRTLNRTPGAFRVVAPHQDQQFILQRPFFFQDDARTYFVTPSDYWPPMIATVPERIFPGIVEIVPEIYYEIDPFPLPDPIGPIVNPRDPVITRLTTPVNNRFAMASGGHAIDDGGGHAITAALSGRAASPVARAGTGGAPIRAFGRSGATATGAQPAMSGAAADGAMMTAPLTMTMTAPAAQPMTLLGQERLAHSKIVGYADMFHRDILGIVGGITKAEKRFRFHTHYHPYVCVFMRQLNRHGINGLLQRRVQTSPQVFSASPSVFSFKNTYEPHLVPKQVVNEPFPVEDVDFTYDGAYSIYNWELFFHAPLMIAVQLSRNQRFAEAQQWFHYIFDPTDASSHPVPQKYWRTKPFFEKTDALYQKENIANLLRFLANRGDAAAYASLTPTQKQELATLEDQVRAWRRDPFKPHLVARLRTTAYQKTVLMKYLDNLIEWGDYLFRQDTQESIAEATQLYVLAAELLGRRPEAIPPRAVPTVETYNSLEPRLDAFSNALVQIEEFVPPSSAPSTPGDDEPPLSVPTMLYFCVPKNDKLLGYWDTVADRLFKIRHCMNIEGVVRPLSLFAPPIDPALLVRAAAAGLDLSTVLNDVSAASPHYRFTVLAQKATELCGELKALGGALLAALEKRDAEDLAMLRARHESALHGLVEQVRVQQLAEATENISALRRSRELAGTKYVHYQKLMGVEGPTVPAEGENIPEEPTPATAAMTDSAGIKVIAQESSELSNLSDANSDQGTAGDFQLAASIANFLPTLNGQPMGVGVSWGGPNVGSGLGAFANYYQSESTDSTYQATRAAKIGQLILRENDAVYGSNQAAREIMQIDRQIAAALIRQGVAQLELDNHRKQIEQSEEVERFLRDKYTNRELYSWMIGQLSATYFQSYQLTYDLAKRCERAFRRELALLDSSYIRFGYWDSLRKGLMAGERLYHDLKRMEVAYLDQNRREFEITRHVSLAQLSPRSLLQLRQSGECFFSIPEVVYDLDHPGHYLRRIKSVAVTIPCVTGPHTGVPCTLTLLGSTTRQQPTLLGGQYLRADEDPRFIDSVGAIQSIVTSTAQQDTGLFETNLNDERCLPFEYEGAVASWRLELPSGYRPFDYDTITDVLLHVRYTARQGGALLRNQALAEIDQSLNEMMPAQNLAGVARLFSARHEFPSEWQRFLTPAAAAGDQVLALPLVLERFPFTFRDSNLAIDTFDVFVKVRPEFAAAVTTSTLKLSLAPGSAASATPITLSAWNGLLKCEHPAGSIAPAPWALTAWLDDGMGGHQRLDPAAVLDIAVVCRCSV